MKKYIVDASVIIEGLVGSERGLSQFIRFTKLIDTKVISCYSSQLLYFEFNNVIRYKYPKLVGDRLFVHLLNFNFKIVDLTPSEIILARNISYERNSSYYDASYHALAISRKMTFLTLDDKYYMQSNSIGYIQHFYNVDFKSS